QGRPERQDVGADVLARVARQRWRRAHRGTHAAHLVRRHRRSQAGSVDDDATVDLAARDGAPDADRQIRIVHRVGRVAAEIVDGYALTPQVTHQRRLQGQAGVITRNGNTSDG